MFLHIFRYDVVHSFEWLLDILRKNIIVIVHKLPSEDSSITSDDWTILNSEKFCAVKITCLSNRDMQFIKTRIAAHEGY